MGLNEKGESIMKERTNIAEGNKSVAPPLASRSAAAGVVDAREKSTSLSNCEWFDGRTQRKSFAVVIKCNTGGSLFSRGTSEMKLVLKVSFLVESLLLMPQIFLTQHKKCLFILLRVWSGSQATVTGFVTCRINLLQLPFCFYSTV